MYGVAGWWLSSFVHPSACLSVRPSVTLRYCGPVVTSKVPSLQLGTGKRLAGWLVVSCVCRASRVCPRADRHAVSTASDIFVDADEVEKENDWPFVNGAC